METPHISPDLFRSIFHSASCGIVALQATRDTGGAVTGFFYAAINPAALRLLGRAEHDMVGCSVEDMLPSCTDSDHLALYRRVLETGEVAEREVCIPLDGEDHWFRLSVAPLGNGSGVVLTFDDITTQKITEHKSREIDTLIRNMLDNLPVVVYTIDAEGRFIDVGGAGLRRSGVSPRQLIGRTIVETTPGAEEHIRRALAGATVSFLVETTQSGSKNSYMNYCFHHADTGQVTGIAVDITDQKTAEEELQNSRRFIEQITDASPNLLYVYDLVANKNVYVNREITDLLGYTPEDLAALGDEALYKLIHPDDLPTAVEHLRRLAAAEADDVLEAEYRMRHADGGWRWFAARDTIFKRDEHGAPLLALGTSQDITDRKKTKADLERSRYFIERVANITPGLITVFNAQTGQYLFVSDILETMLGYRCEQWLEGGMEFLAGLLHPDDLPRILEENRLSIEQANADPEHYADDQIIAFEYRVRNTRGEWRWLQTLGTIFGRDSNGQVEQIINISFDITERREAEEQLRQSRRLLLETEGLAHVGSYEWDIVNDAIIWSPEHFRIFGIGSDTPLNFHTVQQLYHPEDHDAVTERISRALVTGEPFSCEFRIIRPDGVERTVFSKAKTYYDNDGRPLRFVGAVIDITDHKRTEEELREAQEELRLVNMRLEETVQQRTRELSVSEERFRLVSRATNDAIWDWNLLSNTVWWNEGFRTMFGYRNEDIPPDSSSWSDYIHPDDRERVLSGIHTAIDNGSTQWSDEYRFRRADGSYSIIFDRGYVLHDEHGTPYRMLGSMLDLTEIRMVQEALRASEEEYRTLATATTQIVWSSDAVGNVDDMPAWRAITGQTVEEVRGFGWLDAIHPDDRQRTADIWHASAASRTIYETEYRLRHRDGSYRYFSARGVPITDSSGEVRKWIGTCTDIHDKKIAEEALQQSRQQLQLITDALPALIAYVDSGGYYRFVNAEYINWFGPGARLLPGRRLRDNVGEEIYRLVGPYVEAALAGATTSYEMELAFATGTRHVRSKYIPDIANSGEVRGFVALVMDISEDVKAQEKVRMQAQVLENMSEGVSLTDENGIILYTNPAEDAIFGYEPGELIGKHVSVQNVYAPEDNARIVGEVIEQLRTKGSWSGEFDNVKKDGTPFITHARISALEIAGRQYWVCVQEDITDEKRAQQALEYQHRLTRTMTDNATAALFMMDADGLCTFMNPAAEAMTGYTLEEIQGRTLHDMIHHTYPDGRHFPITECPIDHVLPRNKPIRGHEDVFIRKDGTFFPVMCSASPIIEHGRPVATVIEVRDITEEKKAQEAIRESAERFRFLADNIPQVVWRADSDGAIDFFNRHWYAYTGLTEEESTGWGWTRVVHPDDLVGNDQAWRSAIATGETFEYEHRFRRHDGTYRWHLGRAEAMRDDQGNIIMWIGTNADIDDQKRFTEELERHVQERTEELLTANEELNRSNAELERFAYVASHDLQEPLRKITTFGERLSVSYHDVLSERGQWYLTGMRNAAARMQVLIDDLLTFSRITRSSEAFEPVSLQAIVAEILSDMDVTIEQHRARVTVGELPTVEGVHGQLRQLFQNIISNALKFNDKEQPSIDISSEIIYGKDIEGVNRLFFFDRFCRITIRDNGIGFDEKYLEKIFIIFQRLHNRSEYEGTGIGLAICKKIVEYHRGFITARSVPGEGSTFILTLPLQQ